MSLAADKSFSPEITSQLREIFAKMEKSLILKVYTDNRSISAELENYMYTIAKESNKLTVEIISDAAAESTAADSEARGLPCVRVCFSDGTWTGLAFHGIPGGHTFIPFVLGLYNAAGHGQAVDSESLSDIKNIAEPINFKVMVSLSSVMCPELIGSVQRIAVENPLITAEIYDISHFPSMKEKYNVVNVPCMIINDRAPIFGKKNIRQILDLL